MLDKHISLTTIVQYSITRLSEGSNITSESFGGSSSSAALLQSHLYVIYQHGNVPLFAEPSLLY